MENSAKRGRQSSLPGHLRDILIIAVVLLIVAAIFFMVRAGVTRLRSRNTYSYEYTDELAEAQKLLNSNDAGAATVVSRSDSTAYKVQLSFEGFASVDTMSNILDSLQARGISADFFASAMDAAEGTDIVSRIIEDGHTLGNYCLYGEANLDSLSNESLLEVFVRSQKILTASAGSAPRTLRCFNTTYTEDLLRSAWAAGLTSAVQTEYALDAYSFSSYSAVLRYINAKPLGSIITLRLLDPQPPAHDAKPEEAKPAVDKKPSVDPDPDKVDMSQMTLNERLELIAGWLIQATAEADYTQESVALREENHGALADVSDQIYSTMPASVMAFSGFGDDEELSALLNVLEQAGALGTFFVTLNEVKEDAPGIRAVLDKGHALGIALSSDQGAEYYSASSTILLCREKLSARYGYTTALPVTQLTGTPTDALREAVSATDAEYVHLQTRFVRDEHLAETDAQKVVDSVCGTYLISLRRAHVAYFPMSKYEDTGMLARLVKLVLEQKCYYPIVSLDKILANTDAIYSYPVQEEQLLPALRDRIYPGQCESNEALMKLVAEKYIGNPTNQFSSSIPGFSAAERQRIFWPGIIKTKAPVVFLTFDDWGSDIAVSKLLNVLAKHDAYGTFFVRSNHVQDNPNLLRAIAVAGHDIASHSHNHVTLATDEDGDYEYDSITPEEAALVQTDLLESWAALTSIVGDAVIDGRSALQPFFRPPTLAVSKVGLQAAFDLGFTYVVAGSHSCHDYIATNVTGLYWEMQNNLRDGAVLILHMSDNSLYTAEALDRLMTYNERQPQGKRYVFARLSDYLDGSYSNPPRG